VDTAQLPSANDPKTTRWYDSRVWIAALVPFGASVFAMFTVWQPIFIVHYVLENRASVVNKMGTVIVVVPVFLASLYASIGFFQLFFIELRKKFIAWKVVYLEGEFSLGGYYLKRARFNQSELASVEQFQADPHAFSKHIATLLTRNSKIRCNYNLKVTLKDGRIFYLPGELDRLTLGETDQGDKLKAFLEERLRANSGA
jgi:hypothetical protein